jgi:signal transduction histidine kinase
VNRPWKIWLIFAACSLVLLGVMGWVSLTALRLDRARAEAQVQADVEEKVRLALWRMDAMLAPLLAQESARPPSAYSAFTPAERAFGRMYNPLSSGEVLVPSALLNQGSTNILLHFQLDSHDRLTSPQVPEGNQRDLAEMQFTTHEQVEAAAARLRDLERILNREVSPELARLLPFSAATNSPQSRRNRDALLAVTPAPTATTHLPAAAESRRTESHAEPPLKNPALQASREQQTLRNDVELEARAQSMQYALDLTYANSFSTNLVEGALKPVWLGDTLLLVRRVAIEGRELLQGCWVDWPVTRRWLLDGVNDLLPGARLVRLQTSGGPDPRGRILATLPARVVPVAESASLGSLTSPMVVALGTGWGCVLLAGLAVALLLQGTLSLSERRAAFVSAVTHELRTPLTTFRMYSEMLAQGMVRDEAKRHEYLGRLCVEADRLQHLIENVLAFARLERSSGRNHIEKVTLQELVERAKPRLLQRVAQAGVALTENIAPVAMARVVQVDVAAVEQILFNLVDNACKYAAPSAPDKCIELEAATEEGKSAFLRIRDHGQGISAQAAKHLFQPFSKSAHEAARTAPGVGLGLALCRRLARSLGGDLRYNVNLGGGTCFELQLPIAFH